MAICLCKNTLFICERFYRLVFTMGNVATIIFDARNLDKAGHGDTGRIGAAAAQTTNLLSEASKSSITRSRLERMCSN